MQRLRLVKGCSSAVLLLALAGLSGCDKLPGFGADEPARSENQAQPTGAPTGSPAAEPSETTPAPSDAEQPVEPAAVQPATPEPEPTPTPVSEFDGLLVRVSALADPRHATEPTVEQNNKTAWTHYKAKQWAEAAQFFARVAARDPEWKYAHNLACALAQAGQPDDARIALVESLKRGGDAAKALAQKDGDLASVRELPWFAELFTGPADSEQPPAPSDGVHHREDEEEFADNDTPPANCPPDATVEHFCWHDTLAEFAFAELVFATSVSLSLEVPERPKDKHWKLVRSKIPWKELRAELGIQHTIESAPLSAKSNLLEWSSMIWEDEAVFAQDADELTPYFWWPDANTPILVLPNRQKLGSRRFMGVVLARKTDSGWRAINLTVTKDDQLTGSTNSDFESGVILRFDGLELFTLTQFVYHGESKPQIDERSRFLCRIRWEHGKLARACTERWQETGKTFG